MKVGLVRSVDDFRQLDLGHESRNKRARQIVEVVSRSPEKGFPSIMNTAELEGFYRFINNEAVSAEALLEPHLDSTRQRCFKAGAIVVAHDTTAFRFSTPREGLGHVGRGSGHGYFAHVALAIGQSDRVPLGVLGLKSWARPKTPGAKPKSEKAKESARWWQVVQDVETRLDGHQAIHVMDREADAYPLLSAMSTNRLLFVVRAAQNRCLVTNERIAQAAAQAPIVGTRAVSLGERRQGAMRFEKRKGQLPRHTRDAKLTIRATTVSIAQPKKTSKEPPMSLELNLVLVREEQPPAGCEPIEWCLLSSMPIGDGEQVLAIVDAYRHRWMIEEYFKTLKTGCAYQARQSESLDALVRVLMLFVPLAVKLLVLRYVARDKPDAPASTVISRKSLTILRDVLEERNRRRLPKNPRARDVMYSIASLGGHIKNNGCPGWQTLTQGYQLLETYESAFKLAERRIRTARKSDR